MDRQVYYMFGWITSKVWPGGKIRLLPLVLAVDYLCPLDTSPA